ncbi:MAG: hypothetical protein ACRD1H_06375, partial [Vicinamibacterales bacterium]
MLSFILAFTLVAVFQGGQAATTSLTKAITIGSDDSRSSDLGIFSATEKSALIGAGNGVIGNVAGFRFTSMSVPPGAIITGVEFSMVKDKTSWSRLMLSCAFEASDDAAPFSISSQPALRGLTSAESMSDTNVRRNNGKRYTLCNGGQLVDSLQEVVDRAGWEQGNAVALIVTGPATPAWARTDFYMSEAGS